jgi:membrane protease YdiL (CAAX protease family)
MPIDSSEAPQTALLPPIDQAPSLIAPWWHTALLIALLLGASYGQANTLSGVVARNGRLPLYISSIVVEWVVVGFIWLGVRRRTTLRDLVGGRWQTFEDVLLDVAIAGGTWLTFVLIAGTLAYAMHLTAPEKIKELRHGIDFLIPRSTVETAVYVALSLTAGFCEEIIFRGYFQKQFALAARSSAIGVLAQAALFGGGHGYEGWQRMLIIAAMGILLGSVAAWRNSLRPGMIMHSWQDLLAGIAGRFVPQ